VSIFLCLFTSVVLCGIVHVLTTLVVNLREQQQYTYIYISATEIVDVDARRPHIHNRTSGLLSFVCAPNCNIRRPKSILTTMQHR
jgi:hypothetical protein